MNIKDLAYYQKLIETRSYTRTADFFKLSQPSISAAIKRLSEEFDTQLVIQKTPRGRFIVTPAGKILYDRSIEILNLFETTKNEVAEANDPKLRLGVSPLVGKIYLAKLLKELNKESLNHNIEIIEAGSNDLSYKLENGKIDIALINSLSPINNNYYKSKLLRTNSVKLIVSDAHPLAKFNTLDFSCLKNQKFITMNHGFIHRVLFDRYCQLAQVHPAIAYETDNISILLELVKENLGMALVTELAPKGEIGIKAINITGVPPINTYTFIQLRTDVHLTAIQQKILTIINKIEV
ncbi:LysR substrate-binding domain-containing protein [Lactobacillus johnsonii]|uniref:LysR substrate-binding domain-containing protein n=1 Tax=Lactobacillus johnsonii TaxID=33959 RepID=UPI003D776AA6